MTKRRWGTLVAASFALAAPARARAAEPATIVLLEPEHPSAVARETTTRAGAELKAAGFRVVIRRQPEHITREDLERAVSGAGGIAAIAIDSQPGSTLADVWVSDRATHKLSIRPVETKGRGDTPALLAIRAVELLRASLLELGEEGRVKQEAEPIPDDVKHFATPRDASPRSSAHSGFGLGVGIAALFNVDHVAPAVAPAFRVSYGSPIGIGARVSFVGPSAGKGLRGTLGTASLTQELLLAEVVFVPPLHGSFYPLVAGGVGMMHVGATGDLANPARAKSGGTTAFAGSLSVGGGALLGSHFALELEGFAAFSAPRIVVDMGPQRVGSVGRPSLGATFGASARF